MLRESYLVYRTRNKIHNMKKIIRKWLEIKDPKPPTEIKEVEIRRLIGEALHDALDNKSDFEGSWYIPPNYIKNALNEAIERAAKDPARKEAEMIVESRISGEEFIDEVVARIKRKQLSS